MIIFACARMMYLEDWVANFQLEAEGNDYQESRTNTI